MNYLHAEYFAAGGFLPHPTTFEGVGRSIDGVERGNRPPRVHETRTHEANCYMSGIGEVPVFRVSLTDTKSGQLELYNHEFMLERLGKLAASRSEDIVVAVTNRMIARAAQFLPEDAIPSNVEFGYPARLVRGEHTRRVIGAKVLGIAKPPFKRPTPSLEGARPNLKRGRHALTNACAEAVTLQLANGKTHVMPGRPDFADPVYSYLPLGRTSGGVGIRTAEPIAVNNIPREGLYIAHPEVVLAGLATQHQTKLTGIDLNQLSLEELNNVRLTDWHDARRSLARLLFALPGESSRNTKGEINYAQSGVTLGFFDDETIRVIMQEVGF